jgi:cytochrome oxidase Cu insertion factor (SCO1/SenC/PrrC family)
VSPTAVSRLKLLGIGAVAVAPVLGSFLLYLFWSPSSHTNYGTLLAPKAVPVAAALQLADGGRFSFETLQGRWVMVAFDRGECDSACEKRLWLMRQVRQAQGKDVARMERVLISEGQAQLPESIRSAYAGTWFAYGQDAGIAALFAAPRNRFEHIYLIDPQGYLMLRFPAEPDPKQMIRDISRLLRYARSG